MFVRFSTVAGGAGSVDMPRDVRGFAVKFYTEEGNFDLVGNNIPVFFIQDAMKFPDLVHSVKMEPDRGFPQAASAHDTFWDFVSLMPESMHMLMWAMSDRAIPRSFRMMEGFGVHTFRFVNANGQIDVRQVPLAAEDRLGVRRLGRGGEDRTARIRTFIAAICSRPSPRATFPSSSSPSRRSTRRLRRSSRSTSSTRPSSSPRRSCRSSRSAAWCSNRNPDNFFAETEQVGVPSRATSCRASTSRTIRCCRGGSSRTLDTQLIRLGGPNFHEIPINRPKCPMRNFQRDGVRRMDVPKGRVAYEPNSLAPDGPREDPARGFATFRPAKRRSRGRRQGPRTLGDLRGSLQPGAAVLALDDGARAAPHRQRLRVRAGQGGDGRDPPPHARPSGEHRQRAVRARRGRARHGRAGGYGSSRRARRST